MLETVPFSNPIRPDAHAIAVAKIVKEKDAAILLLGASASG